MKEAYQTAFMMIARIITMQVALIGKVALKTG